MSNFAFSIAWRYLRTRRRERFVSVNALFSVLGITLGVATLILVTSLMNGIREEMISRFLGIDGHISVVGSTQPITNYEGLTLELGALDGVVSVTPRVRGQVMLSANGQALGAQVFAMPLDDLLNNDVLASNVIRGDISRIEQSQGLVLGERLAQNIGVQIGDDVQLISPDGQRTIAGLVPRIKTYPLVATVKTGMHLYDASLVVMPFAEAQRYFKLRDAVNQIEVSLIDPNQAVHMVGVLQPLIGPEFRIYDWQRSNQTVFTALDVQQNVMVIILALIVLVAAFNIISSLVMLVQDKQNDIAILRTLGAQRATIMRIFIYCGMITGSFGALLGTGLGLVLARNLEGIKRLIEEMTGQRILVEEIYFLSTLPTKTDPSEVIAIVGSALLLCFLATLYPAWKAAKIQPAEALRYG